MKGRRTALNSNAELKSRRMLPKYKMAFNVDELSRSVIGTALAPTTTAASRKYFQRTSVVMNGARRLCI